MNVDLIAIDIDGTLIHDNEHLSLRTKEVIDKAKQRGIVVILATGRHLLSSLPISKKLQLQDPLICLNGGSVFDPLSQRLIYEQGFLIEEINKVIHLLRKENLRFNVNTPSHLYIETAFVNKVDYAERKIQPTFIENSEKIKEKVLKLSVVAEEKRLNEIAFDMQSLVPHLQVVASGEDSLDIMPKNINKGNALKIVCDLYSVPLCNTVAFGNYFNDVEMLKEAGLGVAMSNAPKDVQRAADYVTLSNNEDGVANVIEQLIKSKGFNSKNAFLSSLEESKSKVLEF